MSTEANPFLTPQKYLELDSQAERPSEYLNGVMVEVEAATPKHGRILTNLIYSMTDVLRKSSLDCTIFSQSLRIFIPAAGLYAYPDIIVTCGKEEYGPFDTLLNPVLIIEVLSPSAETYDMGKKFEYYRSIPSLQRYITVAQDPVNISVWAVINEKWTLDVTHVELHESLNFHGRLISLGDIYLGVLAVQQFKRRRIKTKMVVETKRGPLTDTERHAISDDLGVASEVYRRDAFLVSDGSLDSLARQFAPQAKSAKNWADLIEGV